MGCEVCLETGACCWCGWLRRTGCWQGPGIERSWENRVQEPPHGQPRQPIRGQSGGCWPITEADSVLPKRPHWHGCCDEPLSPLFTFNSSHSSCLFALIIDTFAWPALHCAQPKIIRVCCMPLQRKTILIDLTLLLSLICSLLKHTAHAWQNMGIGNSHYLFKNIWNFRLACSFFQGKNSFNYSLLANKLDDNG